MANYVVLRRPVCSTAVHIFRLRSSHLVLVGGNKVCLLKFTEYVLLSIKYVVLRRPRNMVRHISSIVTYNLKFGRKTFIFIGTNEIFQNPSLTIVFAVHILHLVCCLLKCYKERPVVSLRQPTTLTETFLLNFL